MILRYYCYTYTYNTGVSSTVIAASCKIKATDGSHPNTFISGGYIYGSAGSAVLGLSSITEEGDGWYRVTWVYSGASMTLNSLTGLYGTAPTSKTFFMTDYQVQALSFSTPFAGIAGSRSNSQSIIDLTGNSTITASSLTYASDGTFSFNRSNSNSISTNLPISATPALSNFTYEILLNVTSLPPASNNGVVLGAAYYAGAAIYWRLTEVILLLEDLYEEPMLIE